MTTEKHENLAAALAAFQAALPSVTKGSKGQVRGNPNYKYANLADISAAVLPLLAAHGLSFSSKPTLNEGGRFVLAYALRHVSGESDGGEWPLSDTADPQAVGSLITYARRYVLSAMTGVTPDEDDDGQAAKAAHDRGPQRPAQPAQDVTPDEPVAPSPADRERAGIADLAKAQGWTIAAVSAEYRNRYDGEDIRATQNVNRLRAFAKLLPDAMMPAVSNGASQ